MKCPECKVDATMYDIVPNETGRTGFWECATGCGTFKTFAKYGRASRHLQCWINRNKKTETSRRGYLKEPTKYDVEPPLKLPIRAAQTMPSDAMWTLDDVNFYKLGARGKHYVWRCDEWRMVLDGLPKGARKINLGERAA